MKFFLVISDGLSNVVNKRKKRNQSGSFSRNYWMIVFLKYLSVHYSLWTIPHWMGLHSLNICWVRFNIHNVSFSWCNWCNERLQYLNLKGGISLLSDADKKPIKVMIYTNKFVVVRIAATNSKGRIFFSVFSLLMLTVPGIWKRSYLFINHARRCLTSVIDREPALSMAFDHNKIVNRLETAIRNKEKSALLQWIMDGFDTNVKKKIKKKKAWDNEWWNFKANNSKEINNNKKRAGINFGNS